MLEARTGVAVLPWAALCTKDINQVEDSVTGVFMSQPASPSQWTPVLCAVPPSPESITISLGWYPLGSCSDPLGEWAGSQVARVQPCASLTRGPCVRPGPSVRLSPHLQTGRLISALAALEN